MKRTSPNEVQRKRARQSKRRSVSVWRQASLYFSACVKVRHSEKAAKFWLIFHFVFVASYYMWKMEQISEPQKFAQSSSCFGHFLSKHPKHEEDFSNFVCFSESSNFNNENLFWCRQKVWFFNTFLLSPVSYWRMCVTTWKVFLPGKFSSLFKIYFYLTAFGIILQLEYCLPSSFWNQWIIQKRLVVSKNIRSKVLYWQVVVGFWWWHITNFFLFFLSFYLTLSRRSTL